MNSNLITKLIPLMSKRSILMLRFITRDAEYPIYVADKYRHRLSILSIEKVMGILDEAVDLERYDLVLEYLGRVTTSRMIRMLFRLMEKAEPEKMEFILASLRKMPSSPSRDSESRCEVVMSHIEGIAKNRQSYKRHFVDRYL